jgi:hypothetical protein
MADQIISRLLLGLDTREFRNGIRNADRELQGFSKNIQNIGNLIGASFAVGLIQDFTMEAVKLGDQLTAAEQGFQRFGEAADLDALRKSTRGMVTDVQLLQQAIQAGNFGIPIKELGNLFQFAQMRAKETGQAVDYLTNSIVTGIGRKSPLILDNLGISAVQLREKLGGVSAEAASIADVTKAVSAIASEQIAKMGDTTTNATDEVAQFGVEWQNFKAELGQDIGPKVIATVRFIKQEIKDASKFVDDLASGFGKVLETISKGITGGAQLGSGSGFLKPGQMKNLAQQYFDATGNTKAADQPITKTTTAVAAQATAVKTATKALIDYNAILERAASINSDVSSFFDDLNSDLFAGTQYWYDYGERMAEALDTSALEDFMTFHQDMENEVIPGIVNVVAEYNRLNAIINATASTIGNVLQQSFSAALVNGEDFFKVLLDGLKKMALQLAATAAAALALSVILKSIGIGGGAGIGQLFRVVGGQMGLPGLGGSAFDPNTGQVTNLNFTGRVSGSDLLLNNTRNLTNYGRSGG